MFITILIYLILLLIIPLTIWTALAFFSMYRTHNMSKINYEPKKLDYWPTSNWQTSSPEAQGMDSKKLLEMIAVYQQKHQTNKEILIDSLTIIRNGYVTADLYFNPNFSKNDKHVINSCAKSIISALVGIAIEQWHIKSINTPILDFFSNKKINTKNENLAAITIKDLLTMQTGLHSRDSYLYQWEGLFAMQTTEDWGEYILNLESKTKPGQYFDYSNMATFLLSAIITQATGSNTLHFAQENLFEPLGITDVSMEQSPKGIYQGFARTWLKPHDMAKFGLLYLQKGKWEDKQIIPKNWVEESITAHSFPKQYHYLYKQNGKIDWNLNGAAWISNNFIRPFTDGYGYQWWLDKKGIFSAVGVGGQYITIVPDKNLIVVTTSKLKGKNSFLPIKLLKEYILPAIKSNNPLPPNHKNKEELAKYSSPPKREINTKQVPELSLKALEISNKTYSIDQSVTKNPWQYNNFQLIFDKNKNQAELNYQMNGKDQIKLLIGLDNIYRYCDSFRGQHTARGQWINESTFEIDYELIGFASKGKWELTFDGDKIIVKEGGVTGKHKYEGKMKL